MPTKLPNVPSAHIRRVNRISNYFRTYSLLEALELIEHVNKYSQQFPGRDSDVADRCEKRSHDARRLFDNIDQRDRGKMMSREALDQYREEVNELVVGSLNDFPTYTEISNAVNSRKGLSNEVSGHFALKKWRKLQETLDSLSQGLMQQPTPIRQRSR